METTVLSMDLHNKTQIMIAFYLNEYNRVAKTGKKIVALGTSYFGWYEMQMSNFIHFIVTVHLLWAQLSDKRKKMKSKCRIYANHAALKSKCRTRDKLGCHNKKFRNIIFRWVQGNWTCVNLS